MAQVNQNAWNQGSLMYRDSLDRDRQARLDEMTSKRFGWEEEDRDRIQTARAETRSIAAEQRAAMEAEMAGAQGAPQGAGLTLPSAGGAATPASNPALNNATTDEAGNPVVNNIAQGFKMGMSRLGAQQQQAMAMYRMAEVNNDRAGMAQASAAMQSLNNASQRANIFNSVMSNPNAMEQIAENLTSNPNIALKAQVDPKTGITTLVKDDGQKIKMTPAQMAMTAVHMYDMQNGDPNAMEKIAGVNKELANAIKESNAMTATVAKSSNDALTQGAQLDQTRARTGYYNAAAARQQAVAENGGSARAAGGGNNKDQRLWDLSGDPEVLKTYGGDRARAYEALARKKDRGGIEEQANAIRSKLLGQEGTNPADAELKVGAFLQANGVAPPAAIAALRSGKGANGKPLTPQDIADWDRTYPRMTHEDIFGQRLIPNQQEMELMRADAAKEGVKNPQFNWSQGGLQMRGALNPGQAQGMPARQSAPAPADPAAARIAQAQVKLRSFGVRQRRDDPQGYNAALQEYDAAVAERNSARQPTPEELEQASRPFFGRRAP